MTGTRAEVRRLGLAPWLDRVGRDFRYAARMLARSPSFTIPAAVSLALGIAVNAIMFGVVNAVLLRPVGADGDELVRIGRSVDGDRSFRSLTLDELRYLRENATSYSSLAAHQIEAVTLSGPGDPEQVSGEFVTANYFTVLGVAPRMGRGFVAGEDRPGEPATVVVSDRFWRRHLAANPGAVGSTLRLGGHRFTIVGVGPPGFAGGFAGVGTDVWIPFAMRPVLGPHTAREETSVLIIGRLRDGRSLAEAEVELRVLAARLLEEDAARERGRGFSIASARGAHPGIAAALRGFLALLMAMVTVVLLVACANVGGLLLARAASRRREMAARIAVGASRGQLVAQLLVESFLLAVLGAGAGLLLTVWAMNALDAMTMIPGPTGTPVFFGLRADERVLLYTASATILTTLAFGLVPALQTTRVDVSAALKDLPSAFGPVRSRLRGGLMIGQVALSVVLLVAAALLVRSVHNGATADVGFDPDGVVVAPFNLETLAYDQQRAAAFFSRLIERARGLPGVESAAIADFAPMGDRGHRVAVRVPAGSTPAAPGELAVGYNRVTEDFFATIRQRVTRGRGFVASDRSVAGAGAVAVINEALARRLWLGEDPIGRRLAVAGEATEREVVGVVADARFSSFGGEVGPFLYVPMPPSYGRFLTLHVRSTEAPSPALAGIRRLAREIDPIAAPTGARTLREAMSFRLIPARIARAVFGIAAAIALLLAATGLYGLVSYSLQQRMREIGIRVALGADRRRVFHVIAGGAVRLTLVGLVLGVILAVASTRLLSSLLVGLSPTDPASFAAVAALLLVVSLGAGYAAARRGMSVDPMAVLRHE